LPSVARNQSAGMTKTTRQEMRKDQGMSRRIEEEFMCVYVPSMK
jgi:hypothetical protein